MSSWVAAPVLFIVQLQTVNVQVIMQGLRAELERKRKATEELKRAATASTFDGSKRFVKRGDLERARQQKYLEEQAAENARREKKREEAEAEKTETIQQTTGNSAKAKPTLPDTEVKRRLRSYGHPITMFGEVELDRYNRLRRIESEGDTGSSDFALRGSHAVANPFLGGSRTGGNADDKGEKERNDEEEEEEDDDEEEDGAVVGDSPAEAGGKGGEQQQQQGKQEPSSPKKEDDQKLIHKYFKAALKAWQLDLSARSEHVKRTAQGKIATKTLKQCKDYIRPMFKLCKSKSLPREIQVRLARIVRYCEEGEFVKANDEYISTAIGNAPWPIGVTSVGIHARSARENISIDSVAHVMNDEGQRKYLTSVKRLMTYIQTKADNVAPSKKVQ